MNLVVRIQVQAAEAKLAVFFGEVRGDVLRSNILQVDDGGLDWDFILIDHSAPYCSKLGIAFLALREHYCRGKNHECEERELSGRVHGFPPASGSI